MDAWGSKGRPSSWEGDNTLAEGMGVLMRGMGSCEEGGLKDRMSSPICLPAVGAAGECLGREMPWIVAP